MKVLVDTSVWSLVLRRRVRSRDDALADELERLIVTYRVVMIGPIRQELLSGIKEAAQFELVRKRLRGFLDTEITVDDYESAAAFYNRCRESGIQGSSTDFLICAVAVRHGLSIFTADDDFRHFAKVLPIALYVADR